MTISRNDACPCGSGRKYKNCCMGKRPASKGLVVLLVALLALAAAGASSFVMSRNDDTPTTQRAVPQPGPAPAGKVWSPEHGHWHDA